jgi:hypothetical protein
MVTYSRSQIANLKPHGIGVAGGRSAVQRFQRIRRKETKMAQTKGLVLPFVALFSVCAFPLLSFGAVGDVVGSVTFSHNCPSGPNGGLGVGLAFDGSNLWYSCYAASPDLLRANPLTGVVTASYNIAGGLGALAYDSTRDVIWAGIGGTSGGEKIYKIALDNSKNVTAFSVAFTVPGTCSLYSRA